MKAPVTALIAMACTALLAGCATATAPAKPGSAARAIEVAAGVYMVPGLPGEVDPENLGRIGNAGFIVGDAGVIAVDTGTSYRHGRDLMAAIRQVTDKPVKLAIVTHTRQEFLFGASAFQQEHVPVAMQRHAATLMQSRCERCLKTLKQVLGEEVMQGTAMFQPDQRFDESHTIDAIGRPVRVLYFQHSSGPGDVAVFDVKTGTLFAGGLLDRSRIPDVQDSDLAGWTAALGALRALPIRVVVPGHGPAAPSSVIGDVERYLTQLRTRVAELLRTGAALSDVPDAASLPDFASWDQYETIHRRNASILFVRFERDQMFKRADAKE
ncbi:MAG: MBL fold metallo-hydrolase [Caldimonas sp.]